MWGVTARVWAKPRSWLSQGNWYVNITRGEQRYANLVRPEHRTPLPSVGVRASKRTWTSGRRGESSAAAASSSGVGPQASAAPPVKMTALDLVPDVVTYKKEEEETKTEEQEADGHKSDGSHAATVPGSEENDAMIGEVDFDPPDEPGTEAKEVENPQDDGSA